MLKHRIDGSCDDGSEVGVGTFRCSRTFGYRSGPHCYFWVYNPPGSAARDVTEVRFMGDPILLFGTRLHITEMRLLLL